MSETDSQDPAEEVLYNDRRMLSKTQLLSFVDPLLILREEIDYVETAVKNQAEQDGRVIKGIDVTVEIYARAVAE